MWRRLGPPGLLAALWTITPAVAGGAVLVYVGTVSNWLLAQGSGGIAIYVIVFVLAGGLGLLPTYAQAIIGGWVFAFTIGFPAALAGFTGAAILGYLIARTVSQDRVDRLVTENPRAKAVRDALIGHGFLRTTGIVALLRCPPNSPFALTNLVMASTGVGLLPFAIGTVLGMIPRTGIAVYFAAMASATGARDIQGFISDGLGPAIFVGGLVVMFIVLGVIGHIANRAIARLEPAHAETPLG